MHSLSHALYRVPVWNRLQLRSLPKLLEKLIICTDVTQQPPELGESLDAWLQIRTLTPTSAQRMQAASAGLAPREQQHIHHNLTPSEFQINIV
jgi:hypothetical protein